MHRFFAESDQLIDGHIQVVGPDVKHIRDVLRLKQGEKIELVIGGIVYICQIENLGKDKVLALIIDKYEGRNESPTKIILYQALAKAGKMDLIIQKCTELGVSEFYTVVTSRSIVKIKDIKKENKKLERWKSIADEAAKQSKRDILPEVQPILSFDQMVELLEGQDNIFVAYEGEKNNFINKNILLKGQTIHLVIGPEGGFDLEEIERLKTIGSNIISLGNRILRTETAGIVATAILLYEFGDLGVI